MQRRNFLRKAGFLTTGALLSHSTQAYQNVTPIQKGDHVLILGAGVSGLSAAYMLQKRGVAYTLLEARSRTGGRILTHTIDKDTGLHVELGAEWVGASHKRLLALCKELGLEVEDHSFRFYSLLQGQYTTPDTYQPDVAWDKKYKGLLEGFLTKSEKEKKRLDKIDWWRYLVSQGIPDRELEMRELNDSTDFGESIRNVSAYSGISEYAGSSANNEMDFKIKGGNTQLIEKLTEKVGTDKILKNKKVTHVYQENKQVRVTCKDGTAYTGHKLICTLPAVAVLDIQWNPVLPELQIEALQQLQYARIIKSSVLFTERFWKDEALSIVSDTLPHYFFHTTKNQPGSKGVLTSYTIGDKAHIFSRLSTEQKISRICQSLTPAFGDTESLAEMAVCYYWADDKITQGAYAIYDVNQWYGIREVIAQSFKHVVFAGEHIAEWQGFMEGAIQTGEDAALALIG
ncbi:NAD(P)/FAD-dependent oxidoreductase [Xanthocytophaga agilis]|uniref:NAD(P)/FAD-dependent oxidoreductase n=1 Tax=Xanthocytophaga agilis TaxID=3048010 RepID=A0AAE3R6Q9_9BACT|nr:NAD(P)/FAD-dependent oxidoreductase [Xanthocytophaga agilis]MDJ1502489.1 NAD(P)/FAD-dependent oxidoreductase [Xanthocytophaga agilis]